MIESPWWLVVLPIAATPIVYATRRWWIGSVLAAVVSFLTGLLAWYLPPTNPMRLMGRSFLLDPLTQQVMALLFFVAAILFIAGWQLKQGGYLAPLGLIVLGLFALAGMSRHLGITAIAVTLAGITSIPIVQDEHSPSVRAGWRFLVLLFFALPLFLLVAWRVDLYREDPENAVYLRQAVFFLAGGMLVWLASFPMHGWLTAVGAEAPAVSGVLVFLGFPLIALVTLCHVLAESSWFTWDAQGGQVLLVAGLASAAVGGILAAVQRSLRPLLGYAVLFNVGCLMVSIGAGGTSGAMTLFAIGAAYALGLTLAAIATEVIRLRIGVDTFVGIQGAGRYVPLAAIALMLGGFTLAGLPLLAGFPPRWTLFPELAGVNALWVWWLILAGLGVGIGYMRALRFLVSVREQTSPLQPPSATWVAGILLIILGLLSIGLGFLPDWLLEKATRLAELYPLPPL